MTSRCLCKEQLQICITEGRLSIGRNKLNVFRCILGQLHVSSTPRRDTKSKEVLPGRLFSSGQGGDSSGITSDQVNVRKVSSDFCYLRLPLKLNKQLSLRAKSCAGNTSNQLSIRMGKMALIKLGLLLGMPFLIPLQPVKILSSFSSCISDAIFLLKCFLNAR